MWFDNVFSVIFVIVLIFRLWNSIGVLMFNELVFGVLIIMFKLFR